MAGSKPADFYIGALDFFAIVVPGACLGYLLLVGFRDTRIGAVLAEPLSEPGAKWVGFAVLSYTLGHLLHLLGGFLLDHPLYDLWYARLRSPHEYTNWGASCLKDREGNPDSETTKLRTKVDEFKADQVATGWWQQLKTSFRWRFWPERYWPGWYLDPRYLKSPLQHKAEELRKAELLKPPVSVSAPEELPSSLFQWATIRVKQSDPTAGAELDRAGADSKFFRGLALVAIAAVIWVGNLGTQSEERWALTVATVLLSVLFLWRYLSRRWIATQQTYLTYVILVLHPPAPRPGAGEHSA
jgi:hypothetical protein